LASLYYKKPVPQMDVLQDRRGALLRIWRGLEARLDRLYSEMLVVSKTAGSKEG
jgi:hypothetical protein